MATLDLRRLNCTIPGTGLWKLAGLDVRARAVVLKNTDSGFVHKVYYGTRTERTEDQAVVQATALCAVLNALKAKRP